VYVARHFKNGVLIDTQKYLCMIDHPKGDVSGSCELFKFCEMTDNISETVHNRNIVAWKTNRKSYVAYRMAPLSVTLGDLKGHLWCLK